MGGFEAEPLGGDRPTGRIESHAEFILVTVAEAPDITLAEPREKPIAESGESFGLTTVWRFFARRASVTKKVSQRFGAGALGCREEAGGVARRLLDLDPEKLVFIDET